ncbi:RNA pseudouridine synthase [Ramlibacter rhizophilus]|uniref:Dual-specificity RNA pseudouridine synthase RluF n=1 Tax=Ramlibacter rhizophilus TaxID=1781167 RepID=A0A4Z0BN96_9BURK|nr:RNA pseudouridine synthase [Ramlibacter rhizophilus]TFY99899.1 RNA-binding protein [Ramlibacter rhizophilus]
MNHEPTAATDPQRLSKVVAAQLPCSRREAEQYIAQGWVRVDGVVVEEPQFRVLGQRVEVDPKARLQDDVAVTFLLHKPAGASEADALAMLAPGGRWSGDASDVRPVRAHLARLAPLLPLPREASGLAVFSQHAGIVRKLTQDAELLEQELVAQVAGHTDEGGLARLGQGLVAAGRSLPPARVSWQSETRLRIAGKGMVLDRIDAVCTLVGLRLEALKRIRIGRVPMASLPPGQWRHLLAGERF